MHHRLYNVSNRYEWYAKHLAASNVCAGKTNRLVASATCVPLVPSPSLAHRQRLAAGGTYVAGANGATGSAVALRAVRASRTAAVGGQMVSADWPLLVQ